MISKEEKVKFIDDRISELEEHKEKGTVLLSFPQNKLFEIEKFLQILYDYRESLKYIPFRIQRDTSYRLYFDKWEKDAKEKKENKK